MGIDKYAPAAVNAASSEAYTVNRICSELLLLLACTSPFPLSLVFVDSKLGTHTFTTQPLSEFPLPTAARPLLSSD